MALKVKKKTARRQDRCSSGLTGRTLRGELAADPKLDATGVLHDDEDLAPGAVGPTLTGVDAELRETLELVAV